MVQKYLESQKHYYANIMDDDRHFGGCSLVYRAASRLDGGRAAGAMLSSNSFIYSLFDGHSVHV